MFPLWLKLIYTVAAVGILAIYWFKYGPSNYLWFSDIALIGAIPALWLEHQLIASMMAVSVLLPETVWNVSFFGRLLTGVRISGMTDYMWDPRPLYLKALSLFHVPLPPLLVYMVWKLGYDPRALVGMLLLCWIVVPLSYLVTPKERNVNWVHGPGGEGTVQTWMHPWAWVAVGMFVIFPLIYLPTHFLLLALFG
jgi:hypothetical protein